MVFEENKKTPAGDILYCNNWQKVGSKVFSELQYDSGDNQHIPILILKVAESVGGQETENREL